MWRSAHCWTKRQLNQSSNTTRCDSCMSTIGRKSQHPEFLGSPKTFDEEKLPRHQSPYSPVSTTYYYPLALSIVGVVPRQD